MINVEKLYYKYPGNKNNTIKDLNFSIKRGEVFGFLGPSGSGKSTTQNILLKILKGYQGSIKIKGNDLDALDRSFYEDIGVSFELPNLYSKLTARENLFFFASLYKDKTIHPNELLEKTNLIQDANKKVSEFSKGMKMRLNFCRALINDPEILFLDEPVSGLDPVNARIIKEIILDLQKKGKTIFLTTHNMFLAEEVCTRVAFIIDGSLKLIDTPSTLMSNRSKDIVNLEYMENGIKTSRIFSLKELGKDNDFLEIIQNRRLIKIHSKEANLEDIFIETTGRNLKGDSHETNQLS